MTTTTAFVKCISPSWCVLNALYTKDYEQTNSQQYNKHKGQQADVTMKKIAVVSTRV